MAIIKYKDVSPTLGQNVWVADNATVAGDVHLGDESSVWFGVQMRGDVHEIRIGSRTNIQDNAVIHVTRNFSGTYIGNYVTIGHAAIIHAATIEDECLIGMGAIILDGAIVKTGAMVAAGAVVTPNKVIPTGQIWGGNPARYMRDLSQEETDFLKISALNYVKLAVEYM